MNAYVHILILTAFYAVAVKQLVDWAIVCLYTMKFQYIFKFMNGLQAWFVNAYCVCWMWCILVFIRPNIILSLGTPIIPGAWDECGEMNETTAHKQQTGTKTKFYQLEICVRSSMSCSLVTDTIYLTLILVLDEYSYCVASLLSTLYLCETKPLFKSLRTYWKLQSS